VRFFFPFYIPNASESLGICFLYSGCKIEKDHMGPGQAFAQHQRGKSCEMILDPLSWKVGVHTKNL